ncbi:hypothetical protein [Desulfofustis glycolicus]|uniref:Uncharacterized protein n=1 Tax=Desulfofustis glycolicus DSM 9705 TaxID=1121409 RepID=A0A1M5T9S4_9BACT|nr:hypothetical protein [Desulfofustis glycolicus]MCB2215435.1 hypothetical protein [Desulfobulbaceae bacterium]SHH47448.1 hypothetical protein SAMN02745124_00674 [Desulfofustis glycolicus DSM 9705]
MNLSDPFGRMARRHQLAYETMCEAMRRSGVTTEQAAHEIIQQARSRAMKFLAIGMLVLVAAAFLVPRPALPLVLGLGVLLLVWTISSTINGRRYILRYIEEEIKHKKE